MDHEILGLVLTVLEIPKMVSDHEDRDDQNAAGSMMFDVAVAHGLLQNFCVGSWQAHIVVVVVEVEIAIAHQGCSFERVKPGEAQVGQMLDGNCWSVCERFGQVPKAKGRRYRHNRHRKIRIPLVLMKVLLRVA